MKMRNVFISMAAIFTMTAAPTVFALDHYIIDPSHTFVNWQVSHFGYSSPTGKWYATGTLDLDKDKPQDSKVNVTIDVASMVTGISKLDEHLRSEEFFDTAKYPTATFVSDKVTLTGKESANVEGMLTVRGITKPVTLKVKLNKHDVSPLSSKMTAGFSATAEIKRSDFGMKAFLPGLGDNVKLMIEVEANKAS